MSVPLYFNMLIVVVPLQGVTQRCEIAVQMMAQ